jgi:orotate phosphoribosyltransferase
MSRFRLKEVLRERAVVRGKVTLASGQESDYYINARSVLLHGASAHLVGHTIYDLTKHMGINTVGGMETEAIPIATAVAMTYTIMVGREKPMEGFYVRKGPKDHGLRRRVEGWIPPQARVLIVDGVMSTGGSIVKAIDVLLDKGPDGTGLDLSQIAAVVCLVDREMGGREKIEKMGLPFIPVFTAQELL